MKKITNFTESAPRKQILVLGSAPRLMYDLRQVPARKVQLPKGRVRFEIPMPIMAINQACIMWLGRIDAVATLHPEQMDPWLRIREEMGGNMDFDILAYDGTPIEGNSGSSTLFGVLQCLALGFDEVIIAGAPMDDQGYGRFHAGWHEHKDVLRGRVRSLSGWTKTFLEGLR